MKLSAPPPPPPEPSDPPDPPAADTPAAPGATPGAAAWPAWYAGTDATLALLAVVLAVMLASFVARNSDLWLHLAAGRLLVQGGYSFGVDPFSYSGAGREWVNHSWLYDALTFVLYGDGNGFRVVFVKALGVGVAAAALLAIRRPQYALWPWAGCVALAALAAAPRLGLTPFAVTVAFLAVLLCVLFRLPARPGSWRVPAAVGGLFWVWANVDAWFFVGPLAVALLLAGELIQRGIRKEREPESDGGPLGSGPGLSTLARALAVGVLACTANPHHVRVWQLPVEVTGSAAMAADPRGFARAFLMSPLDAEYSGNDRFGGNANGLAYAVLLVGGGVTLGFGVGRLKLGHLFLWVGFALLSLRTVAAVPLFAVVAVPLVAAQLNALSGRITLGPAGDPRTRLLLAASGFGRVLSLVALLGLVAFAWPGWLHPRPDFPYETPHVAWDVEPDPALRQAAEQFGAWRADGKLPADARGVMLSSDLANYCAWYAPGEKVFLDSRFPFHLPEVADYTALRNEINSRPDPNSPYNPATVSSILTRLGAGYVAVYERGRRWTRDVPVRLLPDADHWRLWYLDGRTGVFGWRSSPAAGAAAFEALRLDPIKLAFDPAQPRVPFVASPPPPGPPTWADEFVRPPVPPSPKADEAVGWMDYKRLLLGLRAERAEKHDLQVQASFGLPVMVGWGGPFLPLAVRLYGGMPNVRATGRGSELALPLLALRAARRAIAANPDDPDGYYALYLAVGDPDLPLTTADRDAAAAAAGRQCLDRLPKPHEPTAVAVTAPAVEVARDLAEHYVRTRDFDLAREMLVLAKDYTVAAAARPAHDQPRLPLAPIEDILKQFDDGFRQVKGQYAATAERDPRPANRFRASRQFGLTGQALAVLRDADPAGDGSGLRKEFGDDWARAALAQIDLELQVGRLEDADRHLTAFGEALKKGGPPAPQADAVRRELARLVARKFRLEGNYEAAGQVVEETLRAVVGPGAEKPPAAGARPLPVLISLLGSPHPAAAAVDWAVATQALDASLGAWKARADLEIDLFLTRGFLSLFEGDIPAARDRFRQTARPTPPGWNFTPAVSPAARPYLDLIGRAEKK